MSLRNRFRSHVGIGSLYCLIVVAGFLALVGTGTTLTSIGAVSATGGIDSSVIHGRPNAIRSDEYLRGLPTLIGTLRSHGDPRIPTPFNQTNTRNVTTLSSRAWDVLRLVSAPDHQFSSAIESRLPLDQAFAWDLWFSQMTLLIALPAFLRLARVPWRFAIAGSWLIWLSPANFWWSLTTTGPLNSAAVAGALILSAVRLLESPTRARSAVALVVAAIGGFRVNELVGGYPPWSIPTFLVFTGAMLGAILASTSTSSRARLAVVGTGICGAAIGAGLLLIVNRERYVALAETVYPGGRRSSGTSESPYLAGDLTWLLQHHGGQLIASNQSELSIGLVGAFFIAGIMLAIAIPRSKVLHTPVVTSGILAVIGALPVLLWIVAPWPDTLVRLNPLVLVPGQRALQIFGLLSLVIFVFAVSAYSNRTATGAHRRIAVAVGVALFILTLDANTRYTNQFLPTISANVSWLSAIAVAVSLTLPFLTARRGLALIPLFAFTVFGSYEILPVQHGTGALTGSDIAKLINRSEQQAAGRWASDNIFVDALILASGAQQLSGQQANGPDRTVWRLLDPSGAHETSWNRGASYVTFAWDDSNTATFDNPSPDIIRIHISPCSPVMHKLQLRWVMTSNALEQPCVHLVGTEYWQGSPVNVYRID